MSNGTLQRVHLEIDNTISELDLEVEPQEAFAGFLFGTARAWVESQFKVWVQTQSSNSNGDTSAIPVLEPKNDP